MFFVSISYFLACLLAFLLEMSIITTSIYRWRMTHTITLTICLVEVENGMKENKRKEMTVFSCFLLLGWGKKNKKERKKMCNPPKSFLSTFGENEREDIFFKISILPLFVSIIWCIKDKQVIYYDYIFFLFTFLFNQARERNFSHFFSSSFSLHPSDMREN